jgi:TonB family protein
VNTTFQGTLFDGETLAATPVTLGLAAGRLSSADETTVPPVALAEVRVSDRLGDTPRYLYLPDGRTVETPDNESIDTLLAGQRRGRLVALIHALETHSRVAATATLLLVATLGATLWWGLPVLAYRVAMAVPDRIEQQAGRTALVTINQILAPSQLSAANRNRVLAQVKRLAKAGGLEASPEVIFRSMGGKFPNAFALPGGMIVVSDELVQLAVADGEMAAVLAHEIGHWQSRHGMQSVLRGSTALLVVSAVTGDLSALTTFAGTIPFLLLQRGYSREFEAQADAYAVDLMRKAGIELRHLESILRKLEASRPAQGNDFTYLSTHPGTADRIKSINPTSTLTASVQSPSAPLAENRSTGSSSLAGSAAGNDVIPPQPLHRPPPAFPPEMRAAHLSGEVTVEFVIDTNGQVRSPRVVRSTYKEFEAPAITAVSQWTFSPALKNGEKVEFLVSQKLEFSADD